MERKLFLLLEIDFHEQIWMRNKLFMRTCHVPFYWHTKNVCLLCVLKVVSSIPSSLLAFQATHWEKTLSPTRCTADGKAKDFEDLSSFRISSLAQTSTHTSPWIFMFVFKTCQHVNAWQLRPFLPLSNLHQCVQNCSAHTLARISYRSSFHSAVFEAQKAMAFTWRVREPLAKDPTHMRKAKTGHHLTQFIIASTNI